MSLHKEMTRHAFISHMEEYIKQLYMDPIKADTDEFLKYHKITGPKALQLLTKRTNPDDENSAVLIKSIKIKNNGYDEAGDRRPDTFQITYKAPRENYTNKMRNLYISLFESNIIENSPLNEGAWGYGILDNDTALDKQTSFGKYALSLLRQNIETSKSSDDKWANLGVLIDFLKKYDDDELRFTDEFDLAIELCKNVISALQRDKKFITSWSDHSKIKSELKRLNRDVMNIFYDKERLNEDGEGGGATTADASGPFVQPLFKPIKKEIYITKEQKDYIQKVLEEEAVMNTQAGDFGYDANALTGDEDFYGETMNHKDIMKKSWNGKK